jgi:hypothetical protein
MWVCISLYEHVGLSNDALLARASRNSSIYSKYSDFDSVAYVMSSLQGNFLVSIHSRNCQGYNENKDYI